MTTSIEYALMAGHAYRTTRDEINWFPIPQGWNPFFPVPDPSTTSFPTTGGFEAVSFQNIANPNEIVISFAGTDRSDIFGDWQANISLATGIWSEQLGQAAEYYLQVKAANPGDDTVITFTGHSLGGGLAALLGVFFGVKAVTFDQAPFALSALAGGLDIAGYLKQYLMAQDYTNPALIAARQTALSKLTDFITAREANDGFIPVSNYNLVRNIRVDGELLSTDYPLLRDLNTIGTVAPPLEHGIYADSTNLHTQALLTAFLLSDQNGTGGQTLREVTKKLTDLLGMIFDRNLYEHPTDDPDNVNFLEHLIRHQEGLDPAVANDGDAMLDRFTADLWKIVQDGGLTMANNDLTKALTAFAMQAYYDNRLAANETLFETNTLAVTGGIRFDRGHVAATLDNVKGYTMFFTNYLATLPATERTAITQQLPNLLDWYIQAGNQAMTATAGIERSFMLGGSGEDILTGGSQADVLVGNGGKDTLSGGAGADLMIGGEGEDSYIISGNDTIRDTGSNIIIYQGKLIAGAFLREGTSNTYRSVNDNNITLTFDSAAHLTLSGTDSITFAEQTSAADFANGDFGIMLHDQVESGGGLTGGDYDYIFTGGGLNDEASLTFSGEAWYYSFAQYPWISVDQANPSTVELNGGAGADYLCGLSGHDHLIGGDGADCFVSNGSMYPELAGDWMEGGAGNDLLQGGAKDDAMYGGADNDYFNSHGGDDTLFGEDGMDVIAAGLGNDHLNGGTGNDLLLGDQTMIWNGPLETGTTSAVNVTFQFDATKGWITNYSLTGFGLRQESVSGNDVMDGGAGNDLLLGDAGNDILSGGAGHDRLEGGDGDDCLDGGDGNDLLLGDDNSLASGGKDALYGRSGDDALYGYGGDDYLDGGDGSDILVGSGGNDTLIGGIGNDELHGDSSDTPLASQGSDYLDGGDGIDVLLGYGGNDTLLGGVGSDELYGGIGNDVLDGEGGDDYLDGGDGSDVYRFGCGSGHDVVYDSGSTAGDRVLVGAGIAPAEVSVRRYADHLIFSLDGGNDELLLINWFATAGGTVDRFEFVDGTVWDTTAIANMFGSAGNSLPADGSGDNQPGSDPGDNPPPPPFYGLDTGGGRYIKFPADFFEFGLDSDPAQMAQQIFRLERVARDAAAEEVAAHAADMAVSVTIISRAMPATITCPARLAMTAFTPGPVMTCLTAVLATI